MPHRPLAVLLAVLVAASAAAAVPAPDPRVALARGVDEALRLETAGEHAAAAVRWRALVPRGGEVAPWLAARAIRSGCAAGRPDEARPLLDAIPAGHPAEAAVRLALARRLGADGRPEDGLSVLEAAPPAARRTAEARALRAALLAQAGRGEAARALWTGLWRTDPAGAAGREAARRLGPGGPAVSVLEHVERLEALLEAHDNRAVVGEAPAVLARLEPGSPPWCRARFAQGKAHRKERAYGPAETVLSEAHRRCPDPALRVKALYLWASAVSIAKGDPAVPLYRRLVDEHPDHPYADDALFFIADLHRQAGRQAQARSALQEQLRRYPRGDYHAEALWRLFWWSWQDGTPEAGLPRLAELRRVHGRRGFEAARAAYWEARVRERTDAPAAARAYEAVVLGHPLSYYGALALRRLEGLAPERGARLRRTLPRPGPHPTDGAATPSAAFEAHPAVQEARTLLGLRLGDEARQVLERARPAARGASDLLALALLLEQAGDAPEAHRLLRGRAGDAARAWPRGADWRVWLAAYPRAFRASVEAASGEFGVPADLQQGLIREESALDPAVVSWAGAVGLAQLLPSIAQEVSNRLGAGAVDAERLKDAAFNLRLSAGLLAELLERYGHPAVAVAAYNAGRERTDRLARRHAGEALDVFVESIDIAETRGYVRRVLRSWEAYAWLYGAEGPAVPPRLPDAIRGGS